MNWTEIFLSLLTTVGGGTVVLGAAAYLIKTVISARLEDQLQQSRIQVEANANAEIERLKHSLQMAAEEHRVRYSDLHVKRADRIAALFKRILQFEIACGRYVSHEGWQEDKGRHEAYQQLQDHYSQLYRFFECSKMYLPSELCTQLESVLKTLQGAGLKVYIYARHRAYTSQEDADQTAKKIEEAFTVVEAEMPAARNALNVEFRKLLGVEIK